MSFRELRRQIIASNNSYVAIEPRAYDTMAAIGSAAAQRDRVSDDMLAAACGSESSTASLFAGTYTDDASGLKARAAQLAAPMYFPAPRGMKTAVLSFKGLVTYDLEFQPYAVSTKLFAANMKALAADDTVKSIVILVDSPGGTVVGLPEAADAVWQARQVKKVTAVVDVLCASAAYYVASQASEITALPSGVGVGSIGVRMSHVDCSKMLEAAGVSITDISSGPYKTEGSQNKPLSEEALARYQLECDTLYMGFLAAVSRGRGVDIKSIEGSFGGGRVLMPLEARKAGMIDRLETPLEAFSRIGVGASANLEDVPAVQATAQSSDSTAEQVTADEIVNETLTTSVASAEAPASVHERERLLLDLAAY